MEAKIDKSCRYTKTHEWVRLEGKEAVTGITDYAQQQLSDVVYVELPEVGETFGQGDVYATVESVKAASDVYLPIGGQILAANDKLISSPELVNKDPYGEAWFVRFAPSNLDELDNLMDAEAYVAFCEEEATKGEH